MFSIAFKLDRNTDLTFTWKENYVRNIKCCNKINKKKHPKYTNNIAIIILGMLLIIMHVVENRLHNVEKLITFIIIMPLAFIEPPKFVQRIKIFYFHFFLCVELNCATNTVLILFTVLLNEWMNGALVYEWMIHSERIEWFRKRWPPKSFESASK